MEDTLKKSEIRTSEMGFNSQPKRINIEQSIEFYCQDAEPVDSTDKEFWKNKEDTLVLAIDKTSGSQIAGMVKMGYENGADEVDFFVLNGRIIIRMWWD